MKTLKCSQLEEGSDCHFEASGETNQEVIDKLFAHAVEAHKEKLEGMDEEAKNSMTAKMNELLNQQQ